MDLGVCVASKIDDLGYAVLAEELGYSHLWFADSQMLWSDCYAAMALAATRTERIKIGTGVAVAGTRSSAVTAAAHATINRLAPGRVFCAVGSGNTAMRVMGARPMPIAEFERYIEELRVLLDGAEADVAFRGAVRPVRHLMPDAGFVDFEPRIPLYVSGFGPRAMALAVNRDRFVTCTLTTMVVLRPGEDPASERVRLACGAFAIAAVHYQYEQWKEAGRPERRPRLEGWDRYVAMLDATDPERLHQRIHAGHNCWVMNEEWEYVTPELIETTCMVGTPRDLARRLTDLGAAGLSQVMLLPPLAAKEDVLRDVAEQVMPLVG